MKIFIFVFLFCYILTTEFIWGTQQIETVVYPSEDEIAEAFAMGEISFEQFVTLTELIANGLDPSSFLLEEIPHSFLNIDTIKVPIENFEQAEYFIRSDNSSKKYLTIRNQYASYLEEGTTSRNQTLIYLKKDQLQSNVIVKKEYSGRERFTRRYISYTPQKKRFSFVIGNYSKKFGLGGILGYRGKLFSYDDKMSTESFLFPDYGGFNGVYARFHNKDYELQMANSYHRDNEFSLWTNAIMLSPLVKNYPSLIVSMHTLKNRITNNKFNDFKTSLYKSFVYSAGYFATEIVADFKRQNNSSAFLVDGKHKLGNKSVYYSFWKYGEAFVNMSGGSKTSLISEYIYLNDIQDTILSKRSDQTGGLIKSQFKIDTNWQIDIASIYAYKNADTTELQLFTKFTRKFNRNTKLSLDMLYREKERNKIDKFNPDIKTQLRLNFTKYFENAYMRNYISTLDKTDENNYFGYFAELKLYSDRFGTIHLWLNFSRFNTISKQIDYSYVFIKNEIKINNIWSFGFKLSHRYNRFATDTHLSQFSLDTSWQI